MVGDAGPAVADVQQRLERLASPRRIDTAGYLRTGTRAAVEAFQYRRGLRVDGVCGPQTWSALVEAGCRTRGPLPLPPDADAPGRRRRRAAATAQRPGLRLRSGGRHLRRPDLGRTGRVPAQRRPARRRHRRGLDRGRAAPVRHPPRRHRAGGLGARPRAAPGRAPDPGRPAGGHRRRGWPRLPPWPPCAGCWSTRAPLVTTHHHPDGSIQASEANAGGAEVYIGLRLDSDDRHCTTAYYAGYRYSSPGGRRLAELLQEDADDLARPARRGEPGHVPAPAPRDPDARRHLEIGPASVLVEQAATVARAVVSGAWPSGWTAPGTERNQSATVDLRLGPVSDRVNPQPHAQVVDYALPPVEGKLSLYVIKMGQVLRYVKLSTTLSGRCLRPMVGFGSVRPSTCRCARDPRGWRTRPPPSPLRREVDLHPGVEVAGEQLLELEDPGRRKPAGPAPAA